MAGRAASVALLLAAAVAACAGPGPTPSPTIAPTPPPTPTLAATIPIRVSFKGGLNCNIGFDFSCAPSLSVLEAGTDVPDAWRPADTDPSWDTHEGMTGTAKPAKWSLMRGTPAATPGSHLLVISLTGSSDVVSFNPDGTIASELLARCATEVRVAPDASVVKVVVTFHPDPESARATCSIKVQPT